MALRNFFLLDLEKRLYGGKVDLLQAIMWRSLLVFRVMPNRVQDGDHSIHFDESLVVCAV